MCTCSLSSSSSRVLSSTSPLSSARSSCCFSWATWRSPSRRFSSLCARVCSSCSLHTHTNTCRASRLSLTRYLTVHICSIHSPGVLHFQGLIVGLVVLTAHSLINKHLLELHIRAGESRRAAQEDCGFPTSSYQLQVWKEGRWQP